MEDLNMKGCFKSHCHKVEHWRLESRWSCFPLINKIFCMILHCSTYIKVLCFCEVFKVFKKVIRKAKLKSM